VAGRGEDLSGGVAAGEDFSLGAVREDFFVTALGFALVSVPLLVPQNGTVGTLQFGNLRHGMMFSLNPWCRIVPPSLFLSLGRGVPVLDQVSRCGHAALLVPTRTVDDRGRRQHGNGDV